MVDPTPIMEYYISLNENTIDLVQFHANISKPHHEILSLQCGIHTLHYTIKPEHTTPYIYVSVHMHIFEACLEKVPPLLI